MVLTGIFRAFPYQRIREDLVGMVGGSLRMYKTESLAY